MAVILDFLVSEGVSLDRDKAKLVIAKQIGEEKLREPQISSDDFNKLFCKGMFKKALIKITFFFYLILKILIFLINEYDIYLFLQIKYYFILCF